MSDRELLGQEQGMSDLRKAAQHALDALENHTAIKHPQQRDYRDEAVDALRAALQDEGKQEPWTPDDTAHRPGGLPQQEPPQEPNMRHPKIQALIGANARLRIELSLVEQLLDDPNMETTASDIEYWDTLHDRLYAALTAAPPQRPPLGRNEIMLIFGETAGYNTGDEAHIQRFARAIERKVRGEEE